MNRLAFWGILAFAAVLRFWALGSGIPYSIGIDEPQVMTRSLAMMRTGDFNPHFYDYPGLYLYVQLIVASIRFLVGSLLGYWSSLSEPHMVDFLLWGRTVTAAIGTATVALVYFIGLRWSERHALLAAGLMAVMPLHVRESHFVLTDVPVTFFVAAACLLALRAHEQPRLSAFALSGAAAGLAAATKYPGALSLVFPMLAMVLTPHFGVSRALAALAIVGASGVAFLAAAPYTLLDLRGFLDGFAYLMASYSGTPANGWQTYMKHLRVATGWPGFVALLFGCVLAITRTVEGHSRVRWSLAVVFPLLYFWFVSRQALIYGRYLLPLVPFVCVLSAAAVMAAAASLRRIRMPAAGRAGAAFVLAGLVLAPPAFQAISFDIRHARRGTAALAHDWIEANIPHGATIVWEGTDLSLAHMPYRGHHVSRLPVRTYESYVDEGVEYLIASSQRFGVEEARTNPDLNARYMDLFARAQELARFTPDEDHPGPELRILKLTR